MYDTLSYHGCYVWWISSELTQYKKIYRAINTDTATKKKKLKGLIQNCFHKNKKIVILANPGTYIK